MSLITGTGGSDSLPGTSGNDTIQGLGGNDTIDGGSGTDLLVGGEGDDSIVAGTGSDTLQGGAGNDTLVAGAGAQFVLGDAGYNTLDLSMLGIGIRLAPVGGDTQVTGAGGILVHATGIRTVIGTAFGDIIDISDQYAWEFDGGGGNDFIFGSLDLTPYNGGNVVDGGAGNDTVWGTIGGDLMYASAGDDSLEGGEEFDVFSLVRLGAGASVDLGLGTAGAGAGSDIVRGFEGVHGSAFADTLTGSHYESEVLAGNDGNDRLAGRNGDDTLEGGAGNDRLHGGNGADRIDGGGGSDTVVGGAGADSLTGGDGAVDLLSFEDLGIAVVVDLALNSTSTGDTFTGFEGAIGGAGDDRLRGDAGANRLIGNAGDDVLYGRAGNDTLESGAGEDVLVGDAGNDVYIVHDSRALIVEASAGGGSDTVWTAFSMTLGTHLERLALLGSGALNATGNELANRIDGNAGANVLDGGLGADTLTGGAGADMFRFSTAPAGGANADRLVDFAAADDGLQLDDAVFAGIGPVGALAASAFVAGTKALDADDRVVYSASTGQLFFDADGSGAGAAVLFATVAAGTVLTAADLFVV